MVDWVLWGGINGIEENLSEQGEERECEPEGKCGIHVSTGCNVRGEQRAQEVGRSDQAEYH
jgi:hypothetical protein